MLLYLCVSGEVSHTRESIACLLWEDAASKQSMGSLRQLIRKLRLAAPDLEKYIAFGRNEITVDKAHIYLDTECLGDLIAANDPIILSESYDFGLEEILTKYVGISSYLDSWIAVIRNNIDNSLRKILGVALGRSDLAEEFRSFAARTLLHFDPTNENSCMYLMRSHAEAGDLATALQFYNSLYQTLVDLHDTEPSEEIQQLVAQIKLGEIRKNTTTEPAYTRYLANGSPSIFVAPFNGDDTKGSIKKVSRVFRQELIVNLSTFREWRLFDIEPSHVEGFRLEGYIGQDGDEIHFIATLKVAENNRIVWSERFQIDHNSWGAIQSQVAKRISLAVNAGLSHERLHQRAMPGVGRASLFDRWVLAQSLLLEWEPERLQAASDMLDEVLNEAPNFAPARSSRAIVEAIRHLIIPGRRRTRLSKSIGLENAKHALIIDPLDARSHIAMGWSLAMNDQYSESLFHFETCRGLNPCSTLSNLSCALGLAFADETAKACELTDEALSLVRSIPPYLWGYIQNIRYLHNDIEGALNAGERAGNSIANLPAWHIAALWESGANDEAISLAKEFARQAQSRWCSPVPFDHDALIDWFVTCFPLKRRQQQQRLRSALGATLREVRAQEGAGGLLYKTHF